MKRLFIKLSIFLLPIMFFIIGYEITIRHIENDYSYKNKWLSENGDKVEVLAIGSSHIYCGIVPELFTMKTFNAGHHAQSIKYDYLIFNKFYEKMDSLKFLLIGVSYADPFYFIEDRPEKDAIIKGYSIYYNIPSTRIKTKIESIYGFNINYIWNSLVMNKSVLECDSLGYCKREDTHFHNNGNVEAKRHSIDSYYGAFSDDKFTARYDENMRYLKLMLNNCRDKGIKVLILTAPVHKSYFDNININQWRLSMSFCNQLSNEFNNVTYINMFQDARFGDEDFFNSSHLNNNGASKLSNILNEYILSSIH